MSSSTLLPALSHALSGAGGAAISTSLTYPLDLVTTRLKAQGQLVKEGRLDRGDSYSGMADAFRKIWAVEGGPGAFYAGLAQDLAKSVADQFLFFLFYNWFRARRLARYRARGGIGMGRRHLPVVEELVVGAAAGASARAFTTPIGNVVTRMQTARLVGGQEGGEPTVRGIVRDICSEKGILGLWSGYSANLILTLNPSLTFFFNQFLERRFITVEDVPGKDDNHSQIGAAAVFFLAATSKAMATAITYPAQIAKARVQVSHKSTQSTREVASGDKTSSEKADPAVLSTADKARNLARDTILATIVRIARTEGIGALYGGIGGELLKAFFNHGTTMLSKDMVHKLLVRLYFVVLAMLHQYPEVRYKALRASRNVTDQVLRLRNVSTKEATALKREGMEQAGRAYRKGETVVANLVDGSQRLITGQK